MSETQTPIEGWAILELFGHSQLAGYVTTAIIGTSGMLRVDVPEVDGAPAYTRFYGPGAIYSLTLVTEDLARKAIRAIRPQAVTVYIPSERHISESTMTTADDEEYYTIDTEDEDR